MTITLYYAPNTRAVRVAFLLEELGVSYAKHVFDLDGGEHKHPTYLRLHPHGLVPALQDGETVIFETAAICLYLADRFPEKMLAPPPASPQRAAYYQWIVYSVATLEPILSDIWLQLKCPREQRDSSVLAQANQRFAAVAAVLSGALVSPYLLGDRFSAADVLVGAMLVWARSMELLGAHPKLAAYAARIGARPAFGRA